MSMHIIHWWLYNYLQFPWEYLLNISEVITFCNGHIYYGSPCIWKGKIWKIVYVIEWVQFSLWEVYEWVCFLTSPSKWIGWGPGTPAARPYPKSWQVTPPPLPIKLGRGCEILPPVKFFVEFRSAVSEEKTKMSRQIGGQGGHLVFPIDPKNTNLVDGWTNLRSI